MYENGSTSSITKKEKEQFLQQNNKKSISLSSKNKLLLFWIIAIEYTVLSKIANSSSFFEKTAKNKPFLPLNKDEII